MTCAPKVKMDAQDRRAAHLSVKHQHQLCLGHCCNCLDHCLPVLVIPAVLLPTRYNSYHNSSPVRSKDEGFPILAHYHKAHPGPWGKRIPQIRLSFPRRGAINIVFPYHLCAMRTLSPPTACRDFFGQGTILDSVVIVGVVALGISKISVLHMAMTADPEHRWACCKVMQRNKVQTVIKIEIGAVIMPAKQPPMQTMPSENTKDNKKNSLTSKFQIEIQCSCQKISTIINRYNPEREVG